MTKNKRNQNVEALRVIMMLLIIMMHISARVFCINDVSTITGNVRVALFYGFRSFTFIGVSTFAYISGFYGVSHGGGNLKKLITFEIQAVSLGVLVVILSLFMGADLSKREFFSIVTPLTSQICWYYSAYILLMVVAPFLNEGIAKLTRKEYTLALCVMIVICYGGNFYYHRVSTSFMLLLFVYLIGRYNRRFPIQYLDRHASLILFVSLSLNFILSVVGSYLIGEKSVKYLENNHNPLLIISAMSLFSLALKKKNCGRLVRFLSNLAPFSLGVYLLHAEFLSLDSYKFRTECYNPYMVTLFYTLLVYLICVSIVYVRNKVMRRIECRITEEIEFITNRLVVE